MRGEEGRSYLKIMLEHVIILSLKCSRAMMVVVSEVEITTTCWRLVYYVILPPSQLPVRSWVLSGGGGGGLLVLVG